MIGSGKARVGILTRNHVAEEHRQRRREGLVWGCGVLAVEDGLAAGGRIEVAEADRVGADEVETLLVHTVVGQRILLGQTARLLAGPAATRGHSVARPPRERIHVAAVGEDRVEVGPVAVAVEVGDGEAEAVVAPLQTAAHLDPRPAVPGIRRPDLARDPLAREPVAHQTVGLVTDTKRRIGLAAATEVGRLELVVVHRHLEAKVLEGPDVVEGPDRP